MSSIIRATTTSGLQVAPDNSGSLQLQTNGTTTAVTIDTSQNVLIGSTTFDNGGFSASANGLNVVDATHPIILTKESTTGVKAFLANTSTQAYLWTPNSIPFTFGTNDTERMRIDTSGYVIIGNTSAISGYRFTLYHTDGNGMAYKYNGTSEANSCSFQNGNGQVGRIYTSGTATTYSTSSDYRLKENVVPMTGALDKVAQLNPVTFTWKTDGKNGQGFIAHELQAIVPDCVGGTKDAVDEEGKPVYQDIDTSFLVATLTAAIKEQQTIINDLKSRIETLEAK